MTAYELPCTHLELLVSAHCAATRQAADVAQVKKEYG